MKGEENLRTKLRNGLAALLIPFVTGCNSLDNFVKEPVRGFVETGVVSDWILPPGTRIAGQSNQTFLSVSKGPVSGNFFYACALAEEDKGKQERDGWIVYNHSLNDNLTLSGTFMNWNYPVAGEWRADYLAGGTLSYSGIVDAAIDGLHMFATDGEPDGEAICARVSRTFNLGKIRDADVSVTPGICSGYTRDFYGVDGMRHISPGISFRIGKGKWNINGFVRRQVSLNEDTTEQLTYAGVNVGFGF